jgi:glyoxylase-like metal-dependent hydrolase (beta-lactamase superfamily II)
VPAMAGVLAGVALAAAASEVPKQAAKPPQATPSRAAPARAPVVARPAAVTLAPGVSLVPGGFAPGQQPDGNSVVFDAPEGLVVFDTGRHRAHSDALLSLAKDRKRPVAVVVNSHWHLDHVSGNPRLRAAHPALVVLASPAIDGAFRGFLAASRKQAQAFLAQPGGDPGMRAEIGADLATIESGPAIAPDERIRAAAARKLAGRPMRIGYEGGAVTAGDLWLHDETSGVLAAGDLVTLPVPFLDTACPSRWRASLESLGEVRFRQLVPGHGRPLSRAEFETYRGAFGALLDCAATKAPAAHCATVWRQGVKSLAGPTEAGPPGLLEYYIDLLRDPARQSLLCAGNGGA